MSPSFDRRSVSVCDSDAELTALIHDLRFDGSFSDIEMTEADDVPFAGGVACESPVAVQLVDVNGVLVPLNGSAESQHDGDNYFPAMASPIDSESPWEPIRSLSCSSSEGLIEGPQKYYIVVLSPDALGLALRPERRLAIMPMEGLASVGVCNVEHGDKRCEPRKSVD